MTPRLAPVEALIDAARTGADDLGAALEELFSGLATTPEEMAWLMRDMLGETVPAGMGGTGVAVGHEAALFAVRSERSPVLSVDGSEPLEMTAISGTPYWFRLETIEQGRLHTFRFGVEGEWGSGGDVAGYNAESYEPADVERGTVSEKRTVSSRIYPGSVTDYWAYANHGIDEAGGAPLMVWHDGSGLLEPADLVGLRVQIVTDNLVHLGRIPPMVHVLVSPSADGDEVADCPDDDKLRAMRSLQYDTVSDRYGRHIVEEVLPDAERLVKLRADAYSRGVAGASSGGICAFTMPWFQPDQFSRVHSAIGSFTGLQWDPEDDLVGGFMLSNLVRREPRRNIRIWMSDGMNDFEVGPQGFRDWFVAGSWPLNNIQLANALKLSGYDFHFRFGDGYHSLGQAALDLPESLAWLWRDYDPDRTEQTYEQEADERAKPVFRVRIANRD